MNKKKGQATVEAILLMVLLMGIAKVVIEDGMKTGGWMRTLVDAPGNHIRGMSIAGAWIECDTPPVPPSASSGCPAMNEHPNQGGPGGKHLQVQGVNSR